MNRLELIHSVSDKISAKSYLEIGVEQGIVFSKINIDYKVGVDPSEKSKATVFEDSDTFFSKNKDKFDLIFIDGLHHADQVEKDINNSLNFLNENGYIVCHDMLPTSKILQEVPRKQGVWTGDCWKAWVKIRSTRPDLLMFVVDTDWGCGVITRGEQSLIKVQDELTFENFQKNKNQWMNIISVKEFKEIIK